MFSFDFLLGKLLNKGFEHRIGIGMQKCESDGSGRDLGLQPDLRQDILIELLGYKFFDHAAHSHSDFGEFD